MSAELGTAGDATPNLPAPATAGGLVVPLAALVASAQRALGCANAASQAAAWPAELAALGWPAPRFVIATLDLSVPCLVRERGREMAVLELVGGEAAMRGDCRRLVLNLTWSPQGGSALRVMRLDASGGAPVSIGEEEP